MLIETTQQNIFLQFLMNKRWSPIKHLMLLVPLVSVFIPTMSPDGEKLISNYKEIMAAVYNHGIFMLCISVVIVYFNLFFFVPRLLFKNRYLYYSAAALGLGVLYFAGEYLHGNYAYKGLEKYIDIPKLTIRNFIDTLLLPMIFLGATTGYKVFKKWIVDTQRLNDLQKAKLEEELTNLKNQVNPHFLFNTLNNLSTLIQTDTDKASQVVHGLSDVLKYQIYESNKELILLNKDIEILSQFLFLEKIRRDRFSYEIAINDTIDGLLVPPLLFINFIDNSVKHSLDNRSASYIKICFGVKEKHLMVDIENSKPSFIVQREKGGLGLKNIQRRLDLLYGKHYALQLLDEPNKYIVHLKIPL